MTLETVINEFIKVKLERPSNADELLDFVQKSYISGELSFSQYRTLFHELNAQGAKKPEEYFVGELRFRTN